MGFTVEKEVNSQYSEHDDNLAKYLRQLPHNADEATIRNSFITPAFFPALGFLLQEQKAEFKTRVIKSKHKDFKLYFFNKLILMTITDGRIRLRYRANPRDRSIKKITAKVSPSLEVNC